MSSVQLALLVDHNNPESVISEVQSLYRYHYQNGFELVESVFWRVKDLFEGKFPGYRACNTDYHDLAHTFDCFVASARLMDGKNIRNASFSENMARMLLIGALFHDVGYILEESDTARTGAKYTATHVERSVTFVKRNASIFKLDDDQCNTISDLILCTGLNTRWDNIRAEGGELMIAGAILGSADLLGQMSDRAYLEKLLFLYYEFREAGIPGFNTEFDILRKTFEFYEMTRDRLDMVLFGSYGFALDHFQKRYDVAENLYLSAIDRQMDYLNSIIDDHSSNFRKKLKRIDLESVDPKYQESLHS
jgi:hypothetical protein